MWIGTATGALTPFRVGGCDSARAVWRMVLTNTLRPVPPIVLPHSNWAEAGLLNKLKERAAGRKLSDLTVGPVITWTTDAILAHMQRLLQIPGACTALSGTAAGVLCLRGNTA